MKLIRNHFGNKNPNYTHGDEKIRLYHIWGSIKQRVLNSKNKDYPDYGGRGITICDEWLEYIPFRDWALNNGYAENLTIDRKNNNGNYEPSNCRWMPLEENARYKRTTKLTQEKVNEIRYLYSTNNYTQRDLAKKFNVSQMHISDIINNKTWKNRKND